MNDVLYTLDRTGGGTDLYTIDLGTGATTIVGPMGISRMAGLAFRVTAMPEPGTLVVLGFGLAGLGWARRKPVV